MQVQDSGNDRNRSSCISEFLGRGSELLRQHLQTFVLNMKATWLWGKGRRTDYSQSARSMLI